MFQLLIFRVPYYNKCVVMMNFCRATDNISNALLSQDLEEEKRRNAASRTSAVSGQQAAAVVAAQQDMGGNVEIQPNAQVRCFCVLAFLCV